MRLTKGIGLLELLIAISLSTLILFASSAIYLSGWQMFRDAQYIAQAQRNAMVPMMHIVKQLQQMAGGETGKVTIGPPPEPLPPPFSSVEFRTYTDPPDFPTGPTENHNYYWQWDPTQPLYQHIFFDGNSIGNHITDCQFIPDFTHGYISHEILIEATDNNGNNPYTLRSRVESRYVVVPHVY